MIRTSNRYHTLGTPHRCQPPAGAVAKRPASKTASDERVSPVAGGWLSRLWACCLAIGRAWRDDLVRVCDDHPADCACEICEFPRPFCGNCRAEDALSCKCNGGEA